MVDYVRIAARYERLEEISEKVLKLEEFLSAGHVTSSVEYPKGYRDSSDGYVTLEISGTYIFSGQAMDILLSILEKKKVPGRHQVKVELVVEHTSENTRLIFKVPDIYERMDIPEATEQETAELSGMSVEQLNALLNKRK